MPADLEMGFLERLRFGWGRNTVRILLDVDGVIAPEGQLEDGDYRVFRKSGWATWRIRNEVLQWLIASREDSRVELVWSTTWQKYANSIFEELDLEPIEWLPFDETYQMPGQWYKREGIRRFLEDSPDPIVIVDDEIPPAFLSISNPRLLCVKPDRLTGLTGEELARIEEFIADYRAGNLS